MAASDVILILAQPSDDVARRVGRTLERRGERPVIVDTAEIPLTTTVSATLPSGADCWEGELVCADGRRVPFGAIKSVWYRRPAAFPRPNDVGEGVADFMLRELRLGFGGLLRAEHAYWMNHLERMVSADYKPFQIRVAAEVGLLVPRTLITSDTAAACEFIEECGGQAIYKALGWGNLFSDDQWGTSLVSTADVERQPPTGTLYQLQQPIEKLTELRVVYVDGRLLVFEVHALHTERGALDWRKAHVDDQVIAVYDRFPDEQADKLVELHRRLGLTYGAADFIVAPDGELYFLETNPNGEWEWLERRTGVAIGGEIAACLARGSSAGVSAS
jgi:glutathione synthase/RimK-type ligase-like ATP-grasp enzyme